MPLPRIQPINPISKKEPFDDPDWLFEFKYDGFRALLYLEQGRSCRFISRNANILGRFDALCDQVAARLAVDDAILDGEVIAADETGRPQFYDLLRRARKPAYVAFDLTCAPCPSASASSALKGSFPKGHRSSPMRFLSTAGDESSSTSCARTTSRAWWQSVSQIPTTGASDGSKSRTPTIRRKRGEASCSIGEGREVI
jgi:hypothetical protein